MCIQFECYFQNASPKKWDGALTILQSGNPCEAIVSARGSSCLLYTSLPVAIALAVIPFTLLLTKLYFRLHASATLWAYVHRVPKLMYRPSVLFHHLVTSASILCSCILLTTHKDIHLKLYRHSLHGGFWMPHRPVSYTHLPFRPC